MNVLYECVVGSYMHGTATKKSDKDTRVLYRDSLKDRLSPFGGTKSRQDRYTDRVYYELSHFANMLWKNNPTVVEMCYGIHPIGDLAFVRTLVLAAIDSEKYISQCNGMIMGMAHHGKPKSYYHAARIHTHATLFAKEGILEFDAREYPNYLELVAIKAGEEPLDPKYLDKVEAKQYAYRQSETWVDMLVVEKYMEDA